MQENVFVEQEMERRLDRYRTDAATLDTLREMNEALATTARPEPSGIERPNLFIFGLPRSGTTLLYQLLAYSLKIGYINNIAARFWLAPCVGVTLARAVLGDRRDGSFQSDYGKSVDPAGPHEFGYFWQHWLRLRTVEDTLRFGEPADHIDWNGLRREIMRLQDVFGSGLVHKTTDVANVAGYVARHLPMPIFVYIERDPGAVALSILKARHAYYGDVGAWWATCPPSYPEIRTLPFAEQIARQVLDLRATYATVLAGVEPGLVVRVTYDELCRHPGGVVDAVRRQVEQHYGARIGLANIPPDSFVRLPSTHPRTPEQEAVLQALHAASAGVS